MMYNAELTSSKYCEMSEESNDCASKGHLPINGIGPVHCEICGEYLFFDDYAFAEHQKYLSESVNDDDPELPF